MLILAYWSLPATPSRPSCGCEARIRAAGCEALLATGRARVRWASGTIAFSLATTAAVLLAGGVGLGVASAVGVDDGA